MVYYYFKKRKNHIHHPSFFICMLVHHDGGEGVSWSSVRNCTITYNCTIILHIIKLHQDLFCDLQYFFMVPYTVLHIDWYTAEFIHLLNRYIMFSLNAFLIQTSSVTSRVLNPFITYFTIKYGSNHSICKDKLFLDIIKY